ncbi:putative RNA-directed DNA polymerase [Tanacetum coccineum]
MDFRSTPCVFLGYSPSHHGYRCLDIFIERLYIARHVHFNEAQFPFDIPKTTFPPPSKTSPYYSSESPYVIPTTDHPSPSSPRSPISSPSSVSHLSPTSQTSPESSNGQPSPVSTTSIPTPPPTPPPPPITRQRPANFSIKEEYDALMKNGMWSLVPRASNANVVDGIDFYETFSPVVKSTTIRAVLSLTVTNDWPLRQLDIQNAFLHGNLREQVYMKQPSGLIDPQRPNHVCLLHKSLYGLKQASRAWFERLFKALFDLGSKAPKRIHLCLFIRVETHFCAFWYMWMASLLQISGHLTTSWILKLFRMCPAFFYLKRSTILELLQSTGLSNCNPVSSPMVTSSSLSLDDSTAFFNPVKYRQVVGSLQYVTLSRSDIAFVVNKVCQYMHDPTENHWSAVKRILRYLHGTVEHGMLIRRSSGSTLQAFTDVLWKGNPDTSLEAFSYADWAGDLDDRRSMGGFAIYLAGIQIKCYKNGAITRYKARFVAKGFRQQLGAGLTSCFIDPQRPNHVCLLHKSLYGLKQAPRAWFERLSKALFDLGNNKGTIDNIICQLGSAFALKDLGPLNYFLGIEIVPHVSDILLSQKKYILELLQSAGLSNCNLVSSPMVTSSSLSLDDSTAFSNPVKYRQVVGNPDTPLGDSDDRRFTGGFAIYLGSNLISWTARKQRTVSRSSTEAEYKALADIVVELTWLQALLNELGIRSSSTPILWCDNLCATYLSTNPIFHASTKHVEIDYHFVREKVAQGDLRVQHISTHDQITDIFTKPLSTPRFLFLRSKLQVVARP